MLESTGRLQKCRIYEMTENKTARSTIAYLIVRDQAHENAYARALETLGVDWAKVLPIPKTNAERFPEVKKLLDLGLQSKQYTFDLTAASEAGRIFQGMSPSNDGTELDAHRAGAGRGPVDHRRGALRGVLPRARPRPARPHPGHRRPRDGRGAAARCSGRSPRRQARRGPAEHGTPDAGTAVPASGRCGPDLRLSAASRSARRRPRRPSGRRARRPASRRPSSWPSRSRGSPRRRAPGARRTSGPPGPRSAQPRP